MHFEHLFLLRGCHDCIISSKVRPCVFTTAHASSINLTTQSSLKSLQVPCCDESNRQLNVNGSTTEHFPDYNMQQKPPEERTQSVLLT